eukprot:GILK01003192.1.p1 GENE.GILK01003192.1~~GILK01003192.1.p1  ORF type:complete len:545 (-),score=108.62 GILK01003192.1:57-1649(-)
MATDNKYDRQLRLWGANGQKALMEAKVCLINAGPTGTESLKNLVLPGVGHITVVDGHKVESADLGNNFFVESDSLGKSRAEVVKDLLLEMNPDVQGAAIAQDPLHIIQHNASFFDDFTLIIATQLPEDSMKKLAAICEQLRKPLICGHSYGFVGFVRLYSAEHTIVESKLERAIDDLCLRDPFPELQQFANRFDLNSLDDKMHAHVPYVVLLLHCNELWKQQNNNSFPRTPEEKDRYRALLKSMARNFNDELNFAEAFENAYKAFAEYEMPPEVSDVMNCPELDELTVDSDQFWILARALRDFKYMQGGGRLPLSGVLADMTADTESYLALQRVYQEKAERDYVAVANRVRGILQSLNKPTDSISDEYIRLVCKNSQQLQFIRYRTLEEEYSDSTAHIENISEGFYDEDTSNLQWYLAYRAASKFYSLHNRYPGAKDSDIAGDFPQLRQIANDLLQNMQGLLESNPNVAVSDEVLQELCRYGGAELHNIAAILGGVISQEAVKLITHQYTPINNTYIFNGIISKGLTMEL